jgi:L,D-peptidoglycan transpeptidase YkuD (ErfK/YbiS/YcfS/YnhG family)
MVLTPMGLRFAGRVFPCTVGRAGIAERKREGDGATPAGAHRILGCLYRADRMARPTARAMPVGPRDGWSDDPADPAYNRPVALPHPFSHERLVRADRLYDIVLLTGWNAAPARPGAGSAIFLHRWRAPGVPTAGCIAMAAGDLRWIVRRLRPRGRLIVPASLAGRRR